MTRRRKARGGEESVRVVEIAHEAHASTPPEMAEAFAAFMGMLDEKGEVEVCGARVVLDRGHDGWYPPAGGSVRVALTHEQIDALVEFHRRLKRAMREYGDRRFREGKREGRNLLIALAKGEKGISALDRAERADGEEDEDEE